MNKLKLLIISLAGLILVSGICGQIELTNRKIGSKQNAWQWKYKSAENRMEIKDAESGIVLLEVNPLENDEYYLVAIDSKTGKQKWKISYTSFINDVFIDKDLVIIAVDQKVSVADLQTGKIIWTAEFIEPAKKIQVIKEKLYVSADEEGVVALDIRTGKRLWTFRPCFDLEYNVLMSEKYIVIPCQTERLIAIETGSDKQILEVNYYQDPIKNVYIKDDTLFVLNDNYQGSGAKAEAINLKTTNQIWQKDLEKGSRIDTSARNEKNLFVAVNNGYVWVLDLETGKTSYKYENAQGYEKRDFGDGGEVSVETTIDEIYPLKDKTLLTSRDGKIIALDEKGDKISWNIISEAYSPTFIKSDDKTSEFILGNNLIQVDLKTGKMKNLIEGIINQAKYDSFGNLYILANYKELYYFPKKTFDNLLAKNKPVSIPVDPNAKSGFGSGSGSGDGSGSGSSPISYTNSVNSNGKVYLSRSNSNTILSNLYEINSDGKINIKYSPNGIISENSVSENIAYLGIQAKPQEFDIAATDTNFAHFLVAFDLTKEKVLWSAKLKSQISSKPLIAGDSIYISTFEGKIFSINKKDGTMNMETASYFPPAQKELFESKNLIILLDKSNQVVGINKTSGEIAVRFGDVNTKLFTVVGEKVFIYDTKTNLTAFNVADGRELWQSFVGEQVDEFYGSSGNNLIFDAGYDEVHAVEMDSGKLAWDRILYKYGLIINEDKLLDIYGSIYKKYELETGVRDTKQISETDYYPDINFNEKITLLRASGNLAGFNNQTGKQIWKTTLP